MENPSGTTEQVVEAAPLWDRMYPAQESEPETDSAEQPEVQEPVKQEAEPESTDEVDSESEPETVEGEESEAEAVDDSEVFVTEDGEEVSLKSLFDAYKGRKAAQADYTKKTTAAAEEMKQATALKTEIETLKSSIEPKLQVLRDIESGLGELIMGDFAQVDWNMLRDTDPSQYLAMKEAKEGREKAIEQLKAKRDQLIAQQAQEEAGRLHEMLGWSDSAKRDADVKAISEGVKAAGIPDEVFSQVTNSAMMSLIYDGIKHRKLQERKPEIMRKVQSAPKVASKPVKQAAPAQELSQADRMYRKKA